MRKLLLSLAFLTAFLPHLAYAQAIMLPCVPVGNSCIPVSAANPLPTTGGAATSIDAGGATAITNGQNGGVFFQNGASPTGTLSNSTGFTYTDPGQLSLALGTITTNLKAVNITGTWNNAGTTFDAPIFANITNTASNIASKLLDLQVGGTSVFNVGTLNFTGSQTGVGIAIASTFNTSGAAPITMQITTNDIADGGGAAILKLIGVVGGNNITTFFANGDFNLDQLWASSGVGVQAPAGLSIAWSSTTVANGVADTFLSRNAAANVIFGQNNVNGAPVAQTVGFQGALAGSATNQAGVSSTLKCGGPGTGTGTNGDCVFQTWTKTTTGTAQATATTALTIKGETQFVNVAAVGAAATPSLSVGNSTTGIFSVSTTGIGFSVNGATVFDYGITQGAVFSTPNGFNLGGGTLVKNSNFVATYNTSAFAWSNSGSATSSIQTSITSPAAASVQFGAADAASPVAQTLRIQSVVAGTNNTAGVNWTMVGSLSTGSGTSGDIIFQTGGTGAGATAQNTATTALTIKGATQAAIFAGTITATIASVATTSAVCYNTGTGLFTYDGTIGTCTVSALWHKNLLGVLARADDPLSMLRPIVYTYRQNNDGIGDDRVHVGLAADDVAMMDPRCVAYDTQGRLSNYEDRCVLAYLVADHKQLRADNDNLRSELEIIKRSIAR